MTGESPHVIYPQYCFRLSPTIETWCRFRAREIHDLISHRGFEGKSDSPVLQPEVDVD